MIPDDDMRKIEAEEIYRAEVRRKLAGERAGPLKKLWEICNKPIFLWILSAVVATWWTSYLTEQNLFQKAELERQERVATVHDELLLTGVESARVILSYTCRLGFDLPYIKTTLPTIEMWAKSNADPERLRERIGDAKVATKRILPTLNAMKTEWESKRSFAQPQFAQFTTIGLVLVHERLADNRLFPDEDATEMFAKINSLGTLIKTLERLLDSELDLDADDQISRQWAAIGEVDEIVDAANSYGNTLIGLAGEIPMHERVTTGVCVF